MLSLWSCSMRSMLLLLFMNINIDIKYKLSTSTAFIDKSTNKGWPKIIFFTEFAES